MLNQQICQYIRLADEHKTTEIRQKLKARMTVLSTYDSAGTALLILVQKLASLLISLDEERFYDIRSIHGLQFQSDRLLALGLLSILAENPECPQQTVSISILCKSKRLPLLCRGILNMLPFYQISRRLIFSFFAKGTKI